MRIPDAFRRPIGDAVAALRIVTCPHCPNCAAATLTFHGGRNRRRLQSAACLPWRRSPALQRRRCWQVLRSGKVVRKPTNHHGGLLGGVPVVPIAMLASQTAALGSRLFRGPAVTRSFRANAVVSADVSSQYFEEAIVRARPIRVGIGGF